MPFTNFDNRHFATTEKTAVNNAVTAIETALATTRLLWCFEKNIT